MLGNKKSVDLYKLFKVVKENGGYDAVSKNRLWDLVGEQSGLGTSIGSFVQLIYNKYLITLEICLKQAADNKVSDCSLEFNRVDFGRHLMELHAEFEGSLSDCTDEELGDEMCRHSEFKTQYKRQDGEVLFDAKGVKSRSVGANKVRNGGLFDLNIPGFELNELPTTIELNELSPGNLCIKSEVNKMPILSDGGKRCSNDDDVLILNPCSNDDDVLILDPSDVNKESFKRKRKRESMQGMLSWLTGIAKDPCGPVVDSIPEKSKWRSHSKEKVWKQALLFREAVFLKRHAESNSEQLNWQLLLPDNLKKFFGLLRNEGYDGSL
ncbi:hypothetical protein K1719_018906 [Acacia pycnantha]|nr:hypothetical protein K1719_018906 [Acacia pycnantha]